ncbi:hypothetical protein PISMIDRAFT_493290 [Pisolithus microcarpus 441]|uniref:Uncharacterized protein n=1 Tax=Pisolithus microcarpus 441 TaxID=765257 RepID=A0A0C9Z0W4_9AGAM|nr:hypothetical protein PISMIDRAFT_493290 [Pisolithus microcarpus 441]
MASRWFDFDPKYFQGKVEYTSLRIDRRATIRRDIHSRMSESSLSFFRCSNTSTRCQVGELITHHFPNFAS